MPVRDQCQTQVVQALKKAGWHVVKEQVLIRLGEKKRKVFADLLLEHHNEDAVEALIVVEVK